MADLTSDSEILKNTVLEAADDGRVVMTITLPVGDPLRSEPVTQERMKEIGIQWCDTVRQTVVNREAAAEEKGLALKREALALSSPARSADDKDTTPQDGAPGEAGPDSSELSEAPAKAETETEDLAAFVAHRLPALRRLERTYERRQVEAQARLVGIRSEIDMLSKLEGDTTDEHE